MKYILITLLVLAIAGFSSCKKEPSINPLDETTTSSVLAVNTTFTTEVMETTTIFTEESRWNMESSHALWRNNKDAVIKRIKKELVDKGWDGLEVNTFSEARYMFTYEITGFKNLITVSVFLVFSEVAPEGEHNYVTYTSETGRVYNSEEILDANDQRLYDYMHDESIPQVE